MKKYLAIARSINGQENYLRTGWGSADAYTDDLGNAMLFTSLNQLPPVAHCDEYIVEVQEDDEGSLSVI
ncbi:hypothetical protein [Brevibacillus choshinensis]|uniref:Uncharacterized protein n=1 Tax=Brevibacillus choshinensis TaxID=54911 RepID=A0ABX7FIX0_BRECH|nr:hypothetical protein [Brevibacillus choshinensis]QRG65271.1 hypothetical protein JNE38_16645 [Brevibacillus choshinensis]